jgi:hypothetical protein
MSFGRKIQGSKRRLILEAISVLLVGRYAGFSGTVHTWYYSKRRLISEEICVLLVGRYA